MSISQLSKKKNCLRKELWKNKRLLSLPFGEVGGASYKTSHSGFVYCRYFPRKEKVGGKRGLKASFRVFTK